jgi:kojibiose phosphorylase
MGPDEYLCITNNDAYTNEMVRRALRFTLAALATLQAERPEEHAALVRRLAIRPAELADYASIADGLPLGVDSRGVIQQCDHFEELEDVDFASVWKDRSRPFGHFISQERNYRSKALKQADVLMLPYLFPGDFEMLAANYDYYEPLTTHDSSLSCVIHAVLATRLGRREEGLALFQRALGIDFDPEAGGAAEGIHIANCGGIWQAVILGFAGMSWAYESGTLSFDPRLPPGWQVLQFPVCWKGARYSVRITPEGVELHEVTG